MQIIQLLLKEMADEAKTTRKMLSRIPEDKYNWKPHEKSMPLHNLATHIAELPAWVSLTLTTDELDFNANAYKPTVVKNNTELLKLLEDSLASGKAELEKADEKKLEETWVLRSGETIHTSGSKYDMIRVAYSQTIHHRAQLGVYLRLLNIPLPGSYGPTADEPGM